MGLFSLSTLRPSSGVLENAIIPSLDCLLVHLPPPIHPSTIPTLKFPTCSSPQHLLLPHHTIWSLVRDQPFLLATIPHVMSPHFLPKGKKTVMYHIKLHHMGLMGLHCPDLWFSRTSFSAEPLLSKWKTQYGNN